MKYRINLQTPDKDATVTVPENAIVIGAWQNPGKPVGIAYLTPVEEEKAGEGEEDEGEDEP